MDGTHRKNQLLLLDDDEQLRRSIAISLKIHDFVVHQARDGRRGLEVLSRITPDLIISDIHMPEMDGFAFLEAIRRNPRLTQIPFIFLTADDASEEIQAGREYGVEDYITKPIQVDKLLRIINARLLRAAELRVSFFNQAFLQTVLVLARTIEGRDKYTHGHVERVAKYADWFCRSMSWSEQRLETVKYGARLHDIGKITIPDRILNKSGKLDEDEWALMQEHPKEGVRIISEIGLLQDAIPFILYHHEKWDGSGYPEGLRGEAIPIEGRMLAIVDVFDALTTSRPYRPALETEDALLYLSEQAGISLDPRLTGIFIRMIREKIEEGARTFLPADNVRDAHVE